jgi:hypothetical protein
MAVNQLGDGGTDGVQVCATGSKAAFYGATPVAIRATNSQHVTSNVNAYTNTSASALMGAWMLEVTNTLLGLGIWTSP